ncbi:bifunctional helix-turn-helix transcriptional regulator/GNAT family N-acetyltransferase [Burkholderia gladioli]|uniref:bifunctional helix-turn-helix transcriptional regulator/GNAT family N-acetyltransferase n=1 Tax=Burkholderia gladioli TaxID=28095 RepID=UPI0016413131|nr:helix-turn-helix domain-containing GNAT family N-acetyltransferase [Burkholderia gladioli]
MDFIDLPEQSRDATILELRDFSRKLVRELGFMRTTLADSELAPSAVHAILEIGMAPGISAKDLGQRLRLDKSNTSRQLARLEAAGYVERRAGSEDARISALSLTAEGRKLRSRIDRFATEQVSNALRHLAPADQQNLLRSFALYADALARDNDAKPSPTRAEASRIVEGYLPGCIGDIVGLHARFYAEHYGFPVFFEKLVATELAAFANQLPAAGKALWLHVEQGRVLASLAIDSDLQTGIARLRWFIVDEALQGSGVGRELMTRAMRFVDQQGFRETWLSTFKGLDAARHLYESFGFVLSEEHEGTQWGSRTIEQHFTRARTAS